MEPHIVGMAWQAGVPVLEVDRLGHPDILSALRDLQPDLICVACFPHLLPRQLLQLPQYGALNIHPSLLPAYRGPAPLFWIFHDGIEHAGVTVHLIDKRMDSGPIVEQTPIALPDGIGYADAERICANAGARLLLAAVRATVAGTRCSRPQGGEAGRYAALPGREDYLITADWAARRAFNFARGLAESDEPIILMVEDDRLVIDQTLGFSEETMREPLVRSGTVVRVRCTPGTLTVQCHDLR